MVCVKYFKKNKHTLFSLLAFLILFSFKVSFNTLPFLDDYIQFKGYSLYPNPVEDTYIQMGLYAVRPLAGILDIVFYSKFYENLYIPYFIITLMHFSAVLLMHINFKKIGICFGWCFALISLFSPTIIESTYWLSASSRIIPPLFLSQLAVFIMCKRDSQKGKYLYLSAYFISSLASLGFYEQIALFSVFINIYFCIKLKKTPELIICIFNTALFCAYYLAFKNHGIYCERGSFSFDIGLFITNIKRALSAYIQCAFSSLNFDTLTSRAVFVILLCLILIKVKKTPFCTQKVWLCISVWLICFMPFILLNNYYITFRNLFLIILGTAMLADALSDIHKLKYPMTVLILVLTLCGWNSEMLDYKKVYGADRKIITGISNSLTHRQKQSDNFTLGIFGAKKCYEPINVLYGEHILNITSSDWALTGALRAEFENVNFKYVIMTEDKSNNVCDMILDVSDINYIKKIK